MNKSKIFPILLLAFIFRLILLCIDNFWFRLPQGGDDTERFHRWAIDILYFNDPPFLEIISSGVKLYSSFGAIIYSLFGVNPFIWGFTSLIFGVGTVYNVYKITYLLTQSYKASNIAGFLSALYPNIAILSVLVLREAPIHFCLTLSIIYLINYLNRKNILYFLLFIFFALIASILHSAVIMIFAGFVVGYVLFNDKMSFLNKMIILIVMVIGLYFINTTGIGLSKFGGSFESALEKIEDGSSVKGNAIYPEWLIMSGGLNDIWKLPIRMIAFLFAPFIPFIVKSLNHLLGVFDGLFYFALMYQIFKKRFIFKYNKTYTIIFCIISCIVFGFSFGSSNFGTNIRHRAKVLPLIVTLASSAYITRKNN